MVDALLPELEIDVLRKICEDEGVVIGAIFFGGGEICVTMLTLL